MGGRGRARIRRRPVDPRRRGQLSRREPRGDRRAHAERSALPARLRGRGDVGDRRVVLYAYYGNYHRGDSGQASSPIAYIRADAPPFFLAHGDRDMLVPVSTAREFVHRLSAVSTSPVVYAELPGAQHTFDLYRSIRFTHAVDGIETFADWTRTAEP